MKNMLVNKKILLLLSVAALLQVACKKNNDAGPVITGLRATYAKPNDSVLTIAGPGQWVVIRGTHLASATAIYFNGYSSPFNSALFSDTTLVVNIPADMPFGTLDTSKLNTVMVTTPAGMATYKFPIVPGLPVITGMSNENAVAGTPVSIYGNNLFYISKVIFPGGIAVTTGLVSNAAGTILNVTVPSGITTGGTVQVINRYGTATSIFLFNDLTTGVLNNYDNVNHFIWGSATSSSATAYPGNRGTYGIMSASGVGGGDMGWWNGNRSFHTDSVQWMPVANLGASLDNYALKFEVNVTKAWNGGTIYIVKDGNWTYVARYEPWLKADGSTSNFTTDGWQTVALPLSFFKTKASGLDGTGSSAPNTATLLGSIARGTIDMLFVNSGTATVASFEAAVDNMRIEKIK